MILLESSAEFDPFVARNAGDDGFQPMGDDVVPQIDRDDFVGHQTEQPIETFFDVDSSGTVRVPAAADTGRSWRPRKQTVDQHVQLILLSLNDPVVQQIRFQRFQNTSGLVCSFFITKLSNFIKI